MSAPRLPLIERLIPLAITAFVVGPLAHMALHRPDHHHTPDGAIIFVGAERHAHGDSAHPHDHPHAHGHGAAHGHGHPDDPAADERDGDEPPHAPHHGDGGAAHLGLAPPPPTPTLVPRRPRSGPPEQRSVRPPVYRPLRGHRLATAARARAPPG